MSSRKIDIYLFRHGLADWPDWHRSDDERPLNKDGRKETHVVAAYLADLGVKPKIILTSPLPRASQTAEIAAEHLRTPIEVTKYLDKRFTVAALKKILPAPPSRRSGVTGKIDKIMLVGHEPNFSRVIKGLTGGDIKLRKSGVARVKIDPVKMRGRLHWLLTPETCRA